MKIVTQTALSTTCDWLAAGNASPLTVAIKNIHYYYYYYYTRARGEYNDDNTRRGYRYLPPFPSRCLKTAVDARPRVGRNRSNRQARRLLPFSSPPS